MTDVDKSPDRVCRMFDSIAPYYDFFNHFFTFGVDCLWRRRVAGVIFSELSGVRSGVVNILDSEQIVVGEDGQVEISFGGGLSCGLMFLDVCCGTGDLVYEFLRRGGGGVEFFGIDFSQAMISRARRKLPALAGRFLVGDAGSLPFGAGLFDVVSCAFGLRNVSDLGRVLGEMVRVCKVGGIVAVLEFSLPQFFLIRYPFRVYFEYILPFVGDFFSGNRDKAYKYLPQSVLNFDSPAILAQKMQQAGLVEVKIVPMTFGIANLIYGKKSLPCV
jgi:demethylmenaquinone methyltransferase/2-methoxy-6-polyprenyl-1,4-benzoquinol methylase